MPPLCCAASHAFRYWATMVNAPEKVPILTNTCWRRETGHKQIIKLVQVVIRVNQTCPERRAVSHRTTRKWLPKEIRISDTWNHREDIWDAESNLGNGPGTRHQLHVSLEGPHARSSVRMGRGSMRSDQKGRLWVLENLAGHN